MIGFGAVFLALIATGITAFYYCNHYLATVTRQGRTAGQHNGRIWYIISTGFIGTAAAYLLFIILSDQFQFAYVYSYSSMELALPYKVSAFWAGQEGSFMLWLLFHAGFGLLLLRHSNKSPACMAVYSVLQGLLLIILLAKSPFMMLSEPQMDGNGLNPLLQDPWMVIHPPIVFLGYAGLAVPFAYAMDGLITGGNEYWVKPALAWALFSWSSLGAGIFIGGFWAYKVLGWGGYWAWDPVENSSLVPWLAAGALVHLLLLARIRPAGVKSAYVASLASFILVLYGTFLTRSGMLSDFSTHSFADEGIGGLLAGFVLVSALTATVVLVLKWQELPQGELYPTIKSREFILACTGLVLAVLAILVFIGMSTPIFTALVGNPQNVNTSFYNATTLPLAAAMALLLTIGPVLKKTNQKTNWFVYGGGIAAAVAGLVFATSYGIWNPLIALVIAFCFSSLVSNITAAVKSYITWPAGITHVGVALALIGIMVSSAASHSQLVSFEPGQSQRLFGQKVTYLGKAAAIGEDGFYQKFSIEDDAVLNAITKLNKEGNPAAREPAIYRTIAADLYIAPVLKREGNGGKEAIIRKGEQTVQDGLQLKLLQISMLGGKVSNEEIRIQAALEAAKDGKMEAVNAEMLFKNGRGMGIPVQILDHYEVTLNGVNPNEGAISIRVRNTTTTVQNEQIDVEVSDKPLVNLLWLGTALITFSTLWAGWKRLHIPESTVAGPIKHSSKRAAIRK
ncbi:cytochrome c biogenesis protein CcsA [Anaerospora sp.]|uniref:cytochrome c biogenesis protein CcsA n=1 Tax=Anaerospora sp. TaxID=1960278 RepID=UPI00289EA63A|nr:cytochrome c biogenesis protein CcsA [Anaerospora sp.]